MLTISKPLSAGQAQTYHQKEFTAKEQNYWSQRGVVAGEWQGRLAAQFGLVGSASAEHCGAYGEGRGIPSPKGDTQGLEADEMSIFDLLGVGMWMPGLT